MAVRRDSCVLGLYLMGIAYIYDLKEFGRCSCVQPLLLNIVCSLCLYLPCSFTNSIKFNKIYRKCYSFDYLLSLLHGCVFKTTRSLKEVGLWEYILYHLKDFNPYNKKNCDP
jgi:hypothetical protein